MALQIIDHVQISVSEYPKARDFYLAALGPLGWGLLMEFPMGEGKTAAGFGTQGKAYLWLSNKGKPSITGHVAFGAKNAEEVNAFYQAAMGAGGTDNGPPGIRADYHPKYYAAYVRDPDGNNIEVVWHGQTEAEMPTMPEGAGERAPAKRRAPARKAVAAKKPAVRAAAAKKPMAKKAAAKKPAPKKPAPKKPAAKKPAGRGGARGRTGGR